MKRRSLFPDLEREALVRLGQQTLRSDEGKDALAYLKQARGISDKVIDQFRVGYCPPRIQHELSNRIITPIYDVYGELIALSSRHLTQKKNFFHESFDKSFHLYGMNIAKPAIIKHQKAVIVEGEIDVQFLHAHQIDIATGLCGSALTIFQLSLLSRYCSEIYVAFDGDNKRDQSVKRFMDMYESFKGMRLHGLQCFPILLPMGYDPDDFIKQYGRSEFIQLMKNTKERRGKNRHPCRELTPLKK